MDALFGDAPLNIKQEQNSGEKILQLELGSVQPNPNQPRRIFEEGSLRELADSIREQGVLQPILVRPIAGGRGKYEIVAGERRWQAAGLAGLAKIPAIVKPLDDKVTLEVALIENIQRQDLNPYDEATCYRELLDKYGYTQTALAERLGKSRVYVANMLRLLRLPKDIQSMIGAERLTAGHGKALLMLEKAEDQLALAKRVCAEGLSVRQTEAMAKDPASIYKKPKTPKKPQVEYEWIGSTDREPTRTPEQLLLRDICDKLCDRLQTKVVVEQKAKGGRITLEYYSDEELERLIEILLPGVTF